MRGVIIIDIIIIIVVVLFIAALMVIILSSSETMARTESTAIMKRFHISRPYSFDIKYLILDPNDEEALNNNQKIQYLRTQFCEDLMSCINKTILEDVGCHIIMKMKSATSFTIWNLFDGLDKCPIEDIYEELEDEKQRKVCKFNTSVLSLLRTTLLSDSDARLMPYQPYIHGCHIDRDFLNLESDKTNHVYFFQNPFVSQTYTYDFPNGGRVRIALANVSVGDDLDRTCQFTLYVCDQPAIAQSEDEITINIFELFQEIPESELQYDVDIVDSGNQFGYYPRTWAYSFESVERKPSFYDLKNTIYAGIWEWNKAHFKDTDLIKTYPPPLNNSEAIHFHYGNWSTKMSTDISYTNNCWSDDFFDSTLDEPKIYYRGSFVTYNRLKFVMGLKKEEVDLSPYPASLSYSGKICSADILWPSGFYLRCRGENDVCIEVMGMKVGLCCPEGATYSNGKCTGRTQVLITPLITVCSS